MATGRACLRGAVRGAPRLAPVVCRSPFRGVAVSAAVCPWTAFGPTLAVPVQIFAPTALPLLSDRPTTSALGEPTRSAPLVLTAPLRLAVGSGARYARECPLAARWLPVGCSLGARWMLVGCPLGARWLPVGCSQMVWLRGALAFAVQCVGPLGLLRWCVGLRFGVSRSPLRFVRGRPSVLPWPSPSKSSLRPLYPFSPTAPPPPRSGNPHALHRSS